MSPLSLGIITMIVFILLGISMFLVKKYFNKNYLRIGLLIVIVLFTLYTVIFSVDYNRVASLREPIFARKNGYMGSMIRYDGLGYKIGLEKDAGTGNISQSQMTMFGKLIVASTNNNQEVSIGGESKYILRDDLVSLSIKEESLTNSKATITLVNHTDETYVYGEYYSIEYEKDGIWYSVNPIIEDYGFNMIAYYLKPKESKEKVIDWQWLYGKLIPGKYRIITYVFPESSIPVVPSDHVYIGAEFIIE